MQEGFLNKKCYQMINSFHTFYLNDKRYKLLIFGQGSEKNRLLRLIKKFKFRNKTLSLSHLFQIFLSTSKI